ncbi:unnamed protein product [Auanema sp. JU1783]|nr:unnamed protein product [Auanema sp. JU1783]
MNHCDPLDYGNDDISYYVVSALGERCYAKSIIIPTILIYSVIFIIGIVGNICTCIVILSNKSMQNPTNSYLLSLAISDILVLLLGLPMELYGVLDYAYPYTFPNVICKARAFLIEFTSYASILVIFSFSVERWLAICYPLQVKIFSTVSRAYAVIIAAWIISFIAALPMAFIVKINRLALPEYFASSNWTSSVSTDGLTIDRTEFCSMDVTMLDEQSSLIYFAFFFFFLLPALLIIIMYGHIALRLKAADQCLSKESSSNERRSRSTRNVIKMLVSVVVTFFLCWLPFHLQRLLSIFMNFHQGNVSPAVQFIFTLVFYISGYCYYSNSACNPILYNILSEKYRSAFCETILGKNLTKKLFPRWFERQKARR